MLDNLTTYNVQLAEETERILHLAREIAKRHSETYAPYFWIGTGHVLSAMLNDRNNTAQEFLIRNGDVYPSNIVDDVNRRVEENAMYGRDEDNSVKGVKDGRLSETLHAAICFAGINREPITSDMLLCAFLRRGTFCQAQDILNDQRSYIDHPAFDALFFNDRSHE